MSALCSDTIIIALMIALENRFVIGGQNPSGPLFSHPLKSILRERVPSFKPLESLEEKKEKKLQSVITRFEAVRIFDRANDSVGDTKVDTNKTPFEYTYISQHFGFIIPSSFEQDRRRRKRGKKWRKSRSTFCRAILPTPIDRENNYGRISEREREREKKNESIQTQTKLKGGHGWE